VATTQMIENHNPFKRHFPLTESHPQMSDIGEYVNVAALAPIPGIRMPVESEVDLWIARMAFYRKKAQ
jgi:hypothetical protein